MDYQRLRYLIKQSKSTQKEIAASLGLSQQRFNHYANGQREPDSDMLCSIADYFGVSVDYLLGRTETPAPEAQGGSEDREIREYLQLVKDDPKYRMMFDLAKDASLEEVKATAAFLKALREQE